MKKLFLLLFISITYLNYGQNNQVLDFKIHFKPQTNYKQSMLSESEYELNYEGSQEILETLKSSGIKNPTITKNTTLVESVLKTGKTNSEGNFPVTIEYLKTLDNNGNTIIPSGTIIYGKGSTSSLPKLDSIVAKGVDEMLKNSIFQTAQSSFAQIALPEKKLKIGESFSQENPINIPVGALNIDMLITTIYKLQSITANKAYFDINQAYTARVTSENLNNITASGMGTGKLIYDIPNNYTSENTIDLDLLFDLKQGELSIKLKSKSKIKQTAEITKS